MRPDTTIIGPGDKTRLPEDVGRVTVEAELTVVIGRRARNVSEDEAPSVVAGYTTVLDMTADDILRKNPRYLTRAKSFNTFFYFGPHLLTPDEVEEVEELEVATLLNIEVRRRNTVSNMTFSPYRLVSFHSRVMTLLPSNDTDRQRPEGALHRHGGEGGGRRSGNRIAAKMSWRRYLRRTGTSNGPVRSLMGPTRARRRPPRTLARRSPPTSPYRSRRLRQCSEC